MRSLALVTLLLAVALAQLGNEPRRNWRGIVPLRSTRADVERLLGLAPPPPKDGMSIYTSNPNSPRYFFDDLLLVVTWHGEEFVQLRTLVTSASGQPCGSIW
jgi:hypothetical protein